LKSFILLIDLNDLNGKINYLLKKEQDNESNREKK